MNGGNLVLRIDVTVAQEPGGYGQLRVSESIELKPKSFIEVCKVLGQFQELAVKIKTADSM